MADENARDTARRLVRESLIAAGLPAPAPLAPGVSAEARRIAHQVVQETLEAEARAAHRVGSETKQQRVARRPDTGILARPGLAAEPEVRGDAEEGGPAPACETPPGPTPRSRSESGPRPVAAERGRVGALPGPQSEARESEAGEPTPALRADAVTKPRMGAPPVARPATDGRPTDAAELARHLVEETLAEAEAAATSASAVAHGSEPTDLDDAEPASPPPRLTDDWPTARVDLLPAELAQMDTGPGHGEVDTPPGSQVASSGSTNFPAAVSDPLADADQSPAVAVPQTPWERWQRRRLRKRLAAEWAPGATPPPRRTWRWLLASVIAAVALGVLFPLAVSAVRSLVAL